MKKITIALLSIILPFSAILANFSFLSNKDITAVVSSDEAEVVHTAIDILRGDYKNVFNGDLKTGNTGNIFFGTLGLNKEAEYLAEKSDIEELKNHQEGFLIIVKKGNLIVLGSDKRGTAYGILELSRMMGVSPWEWWADSPIGKKESLILKEGFRMMQYPSVAHRGIFINDEDWGLMPWSSMNYEPTNTKGEIGPKTNARIFELILRLRANTYWPAMHDCSVAFYLTPGNKEMADKYSIFVGTSHCEPMMRNTNAEWKVAGTGSYNYLTNKENILTFWEERVKELANSDNIYTLGIRGVHDSKMQGANTLEEQKEVLVDVLNEQRAMIARYVNPNVEEVSQVFIPYKEVLDIYNTGLKVPEDVTLIWCDDNYGYIKHFPDVKERARKGGNGIYYHVSYWGRPHDYLWLATNHPAQLYTQMKLAYEKGAKDMWILNVGDIKPAEYLTELLLDMAWNIESIENNMDGLDNHLFSWLSREFGEEKAKKLLPVMNEYYRLAYIRKPEFMGNTRTEERDPKYRIVTDLPWSEIEIRQRIDDYERISDKVIEISKEISSNKQDSWFQLIEYPVRGAAEMNKKHLYGQLARYGKADWQISNNAFDTIVSLTEKYNLLADGKWKYMMNYRPRRLAVFDRVPQIEAENELVEYKEPLFLFNGNEYMDFKGEKPVSHGLGYQRGAISLAKGSSVTYKFSTENPNPVSIEVALAPNHPVEGKQIRYGIFIDNEPIQIVDYHTVGRSEEWKVNVLTNQAKRVTIHEAGIGVHTITIKAIDEGVIIDQIKVIRD